MGSSTGFYCGPSDQEAMQAFAKTLGLELIAPNLGQAVPWDPVEGPFCYLSAVAESELHPYGVPPTKLTDARDPLIRLMRSYFKNPYLVAGHINWSNDVRQLSEITKPFYQKMVKWIKDNWEKMPGGGFYIGPEAVRLVAAGAQMVNVLPDQTEFNMVGVISLDKK